MLLLSLPLPHMRAVQAGANGCGHRQRTFCAALYAFGGSAFSWSCISLVQSVRLSRSSCMMSALSL
jgi:hypothetical protein